MTMTLSQPAANALTAFAVSPDGTLPASPQPEIHVYGVDKDSRLYRYGDSAAKPGPAVEAICGLPFDLRVVTLGANSRYGEREYLELRMLSPVPNTQCWLRLPCWRQNPAPNVKPFPWGARSLLSALLAIDVSAVAVKLEAIRGSREGATLIRVSLDAEGRQRVTADSIGPDREDFEGAVDRIRCALGLSPQFL